MAVAALTPELHSLLEQAMAHPAVRPAPGVVVADAMHYSIAVDAAGGTEEVCFDDTTVPPAFVPLLAHLTAASKPMPPA